MAELRENGHFLPPFCENISNIITLVPGLKPLIFSGLLVPKVEPDSAPLLRQVLTDYSFESKLGQSFDTDFRPEVKSELDDTLSTAVNMNPVISMAVEQIKRDIDTTCQILRISPGNFIFYWELNILLGT
jgi:hypothetical protein